MIIDLITSKIKSKFGTDIIWTLLGQIVVMLSALVLTKVLSLRLSIDEFGQYNVIRRSASVISFCLLGGLGITLPRYLAIFSNRLHFRRVQSILLSTIVYMLVNVLVLSIIYIIVKPIIGDIVSGTDSWYIYILIFIYSLTTACSSYICAYYRGLGDFKQSNVSHIFFQLSLLIPLFFVNSNVISIIEYWTLFNAIIFILYVTIECIKYRRLKFNKISDFYTTGDFKEVSRYSIPRTFGDFFLFSYSAFPLLCIGRKLGMEEVSLFSVGITLYTMATPIFSFLGVVLLPMISKMVDENRLKDANVFVTKTMLIYSILALFVTLLMILMMQWLIPIFFTQEYLVSLKISRILVLSILPDSLYLLYRNPIDAVSITPYNTYVLGFCFLLLVIGFILAGSLEQLAYVYLSVAAIRGLCSYIIWKMVLRKKLLNIKS